MKKVFVALTVIAACYACGGSNTEQKKPISNSENPQIGGETNAPDSSAAAAPATAPATAANASNGKALIEAADCRTCHHDNDKLIGPAYADVAKKYTEADVKHLADKVLKGGTGVWGQIPMTPHPTVSEADAETMVRYILSLKK